ncbi:hypothetical protein [Rhizobium sp. FKY42]|uniref:hypothetical protein n=1 Tax=Rhizobium sp. FKY42 TaxID=2562310 RepID=UPI0010C11C24|nr:hypothetical protein [Rhizobium sp. FKY42]
MWLRLKAYAVAFGAGLAVLAGAFFYGRAGGKASAKADQQAADAKAVRNARGIEDEVRKADGAAVDDRLSRWLRD